MVGSLEFGCGVGKLDGIWRESGARMEVLGFDNTGWKTIAESQDVVDTLARR